LKDYRDIKSRLDQLKIFQLTDIAGGKVLEPTDVMYFKYAHEHYIVLPIEMISTLPLCFLQCLSTKYDAKYHILARESVVPTLMKTTTMSHTFLASTESLLTQLLLGVKNVVIRNRQPIPLGNNPLARPRTIRLAKGRSQGEFAYDEEKSELGKRVIWTLLSSSEHKQMIHNMAELFLSVPLESRANMLHCPQGCMISSSKVALGHTLVQAVFKVREFLSLLDVYIEEVKKGYLATELFTAFLSLDVPYHSFTNPKRLNPTYSYCKFLAKHQDVYEKFTQAYMLGESLDVMMGIPKDWVTIRHAVVIMRGYPSYMVRGLETYEIMLHLGPELGFSITDFAEFSLSGEYEEYPSDDETGDNLEAL